MIDSIVETVAVEVTLVSCEMVRGRGSLQCLATARIRLADVEITVAGIQLHTNTVSGRRTIHAPQYRGADQRWWPAVRLPDAVLLAIGDACDEAADPRGSANVPV